MTKETHKQALDLERYGPEARRFISFAKERILGQPRIIGAYADVIELATAGFRENEGTLGNFLITGSSGVGKTESTKVLAEFLFGNPRGALRLEGSNYSDRHDVARIKGAPPGYIGYGDEPEITQRKLNSPAYNLIVNNFISRLPPEAKKYLETLWGRMYDLMKKKENLFQRGKGYPSVELSRVDAEIEKTEQSIKEFGYPQMDLLNGSYLSLLHIDEIEKAHRTFYNILYSILDEGLFRLTQEPAEGEPPYVSFRNTICIATSNVGEEEIKKELRRVQGREVLVGIRASGGVSLEELDDRIYAITRKALDQHFTTSFLNRFDRIIAARPLFRDSIEIILNKRIKELNIRLTTDWGLPIALDVTKPVKDFIIDEATDKLEEGARLLKRKLRHYVTLPLGRIKNTEQVAPGDEIRVCLEESTRRKKKVVFFKISPSKSRGILVVPAP